MKRLLSTVNRGLARVTGYKVVPARGPYPLDFDEGLISIWERVAPHTLTSPERIAAVVSAVDHAVGNDIPGAIVECGVWRGGSMMAAALRLMQHGVERELWLYDTFEGNPPPDEDEVDVFGRRAADLHRRAGRTGMYRAALDEVRANLGATGYPLDCIRFIPGLVEETIPREVPEEIAILRLDTDFYSSTIHELTHLEPLVADRGLVIIDDWGHFSGARKATQEYFAGRRLYPARVDYSARMFMIARQDASAR